MRKTINQTNEAILTWLIAETVLEQLGVQPTKEIVNRLVTRANYQHSINEDWQKAMKSKTNKGRDLLYLFMKHWAKAKIWERYPMHSLEIPFQEENLPEYNEG